MPCAMYSRKEDDMLYTTFTYSVEVAYVFFMSLSIVVGQVAGVLFILSTRRVL
jgi:hypothetical protein